jgi:hypothetical protein
MAIAQPKSSDAKHHRNRGRWLSYASRAFGGLMTAIAAVAAAVSAWVAWQAVQDAKSGQLLTRRVEACLEVDRRATAQLVPVLSELRETARTQTYAAFRGEYDWGWGDFYSGAYFPELQCQEGETEAACDARRRTAAQLYAQLMQVAAAAAASRNALEANAASTFSLIGPPELAEAERHLIGKLRTLGANHAPPLDQDRLELVRATLAAQTSLQRACRAAIGEYARR